MKTIQYTKDAYEFNKLCIGSGGGRIEDNRWLLAAFLNLLLRGSESLDIVSESGSTDGVCTLGVNMGGGSSSFTRCLRLFGFVFCFACFLLAECLRSAGPDASLSVVFSLKGSSIDGTCNKSSDDGAEFDKLLV